MPHDAHAAAGSAAAPYASLTDNADDGRTRASTLRTTERRSSSTLTLPAPAPAPAPALTPTPAPTLAPSASASSRVPLSEQAWVLRRVRVAVLPLLLASSLACYVDRAALAFAAPTLLADVGVSQAEYGVASGLFFVSYSLLGIPLAALGRRIGVHRSIAALLIVWGAVSCLQALIQGAASLYVLRVVLGAAETPFFPLMFDLTDEWFVASERGVAKTIVLLSTALSGIVGGLIAAAVLPHANGPGPMASWQWLFIVDGLIAVLCGVLVALLLDASPASSRCLAPDQRRWYAALVAESRAPRDKLPAYTKLLGAETSASLVAQWRASQRRASLAVARAPALSFRVRCCAAIWRPDTILLALVYFLWGCGYSALLFFLPLIVRAAIPNASILQVVIYSTVPYTGALLCMLLNAWHSDRRSERRYHLALALAVAAVGMLLSAVLFQVGLGTSLEALLPALTLTACGLWAIFGPFWAAGAELVADDPLVGSAAPVAYAFVNSIGTLGGFVGPTIAGSVYSSTSSYAPSAFAFSVLLVAGGTLAVLLRRLRCACPCGVPQPTRGLQALSESASASELNTDEVDADGDDAARSSVTAVRAEESARRHSVPAPSARGSYAAPVPIPLAPVGSAALAASVPVRR